jgi:hypothetical protein
MAYMCSATYVFDVNSQADIVEIEYTKNEAGGGWKTHKEWLYTYPEGDWTTIHFDPERFVKYEDFLNSMVFKNLEVSRRIAKLSLDNVSTKDPKKLVILMNAIKILDPTFEPPIINTNCTWQLELLRHIALSTSYKIIASCKNKKRLRTYFRVSQLL